MVCMGLHQNMPQSHSVVFLILFNYLFSATATYCKLAVFKFGICLHCTVFRQRKCKKSVGSHHLLGKFAVTPSGSYKGQQTELSLPLYIYNFLSIQNQCTNKYTIVFSFTRATDWYKMCTVNIFS